MSPRLFTVLVHPDPHDRGDARADPRADPRAGRPLRAYDEPYGSPNRDNMYASPPGPYDSPDDGEFDEGRRKPKYPRYAAQYLL